MIFLQEHLGGVLGMGGIGGGGGGGEEIAEDCWLKVIYITLTKYAFY